MNIKETVFSEQVTLKVSWELKSELEKLFGKRKFSQKIREYLVEKITKDKQKKLFEKVEKKASKVDELIKIIGLRGNAGRVKFYRFKRNEYKAFSLLCKKFFERSEYHCIEAKKAFICYCFELKEPFPEDLDIVIEYLER